MTEVTFVNPSQISSMVNNVGVDVVSGMKSFYEELTTMLKEYADPNSSIHIAGVEYDAEEKYTTQIGLLLQDRISQIEYLNNMSLNIINSLFQMDKNFGSVFGG